MSKKKSSSIIVTTTFNSASSKTSWTGFLEYTNRDNGIKLEQESTIMTERNNEFINEINQILNKSKMQNFDNYLNYTNRSRATSSDSNLTTVFNEQTNNLSVNELAELRKNIRLSEKNNNTLWRTVVSFDTQFLIDNNILEDNKELENKINKAKDKRTIEKYAKQRQVDQAALKNAIRNQMHHLIKNEGLSNDTFYWGNVHLNTKHIHVHLAMSEINSNRPIYKETNERKGKFKINSINQFKSQIFNSIVSDEQRKLIQANQINVVHIKKNLVNDFSLDKKIDSNEIKQIELLHKIYNNLPDDTKKWRYKSNAKDFKVAKKYINEYIDLHLEIVEKEQFELFKKELLKQSTTYENSYSNNFNSDDYVNSRVDVLKERMANKLLKELKNNDSDNELIPILKKSKFSNEYDNKSPYELEQAINKLENQLSNKNNFDTVKDKTSKLNETRLKKELGLNKYHLKLKNLDLKKKELLVEKNFLTKIDFETKSEQNFIVFKQQQLDDSIKHIELQKKPNYMLTENEKKLKQELSVLTTPSKNIKIDYLNNQIYDRKRKNLTEELHFSKKITDKDKFKLYFNNNNQYDSRIEFLSNEITILDLKKEIYDNNKIIKKSSDNHTIEQLKRKNSDIFKQINQIDYNNQNETRSKVQNDIHKSVKKRYNQKEYDSNNKNKKNLFNFNKNSLNKISKALSTDNKKEMNAMLNKIRQDEAEEREIEKKNQNIR